MYARLRGINSSQIPTVVKSLIDTLMLKKHSRKKAGVYRLIHIHLYRECYTVTHVFLNFLHKLGKRDQVQGLSSCFAFFEAILINSTMQKHEF